MADTTPTKTPEQQIREALQSLAKALDDAATLTVTTKVRVMNPDDPAATAANPVTVVAETIMKIEGDREIILPVVADGPAFAIPQAVYEAHQKNLDDAIAYRKELVQMLVNFVQTRRISA